MFFENIIYLCPIWIKDSCMPKTQFQVVYIKVSQSCMIIHRTSQFFMSDSLAHKSE